MIPVQKISSRKFILLIFAELILGIKILFLNASIQWGWILATIALGYNVFNIANKYVMTKNGKGGNYDTN